MRHFYALYVDDKTLKIFIIIYHFQKASKATLDLSIVFDSLLMANFMRRAPKMELFVFGKLKLEKLTAFGNVLNL